MSSNLQPHKFSNSASPDPVKIRDIFCSVAPRYDLANTVLSMGLAYLWRRQAVRAIPAVKGRLVLDLAAGTGALSREFFRAGAQVVGLDFCEPMLRLWKGENCLGRVCADALSLPLSDSSVEVVSMAFGIRNVADPQRCVAEIGRVLRAGGEVVILEFGERPRSSFTRLFNLYARYILPRVGGAITGVRAAYEYLDCSAKSFPSGEQFLELFKSSDGWENRSCRKLAGGVVYLYTASQKGP